MCELPQAYRVTRPKARKAHVCYECRGTIPIGEIYNQHSGIWEGQPSRYRVCVDCDALRKVADKDIAHREDCTPYGGLSETVFDSREPLWIGFFMGIILKRGGKLPEWMLKRANEVLAQQLHAKAS